MSPPLCITDVKDDDYSSSVSSSSPTIHNDEPQAVRRKPVVLFGDVEVRTHERLLGDNPGSHDGPSITLGWKYNCSEAVSVDDWEAHKYSDEKQEEPSSVQRRKPRRSRVELFLSAAQRVLILQNIGYSTAAIGRNAEYVKQCQEERKATLLEYQQQQQKEKELQQKEKQEEAKLQEIAEKSSKREQLGSKKPNMCQHNPTRARLSALDTAEGKTLRS